MKQITYKIMEKFGRAAMALMLVSASLLASCEDKAFEPSLSLSVNNKIIRLENKASETPISIYSTGDWNVRLVPEVDWASLDRTSGSGSQQVWLTYQSNPQSVRRVTLVVTKGGERREILIEQTGDAVAFRFKLDGREMTFEKSKSTCYLTFATNIPKDQFETVTVRDMQYVDGTDGWLSNIRIENRVLAFDVTENDTGAPRSATITAVYIDKYDNDAEYETTAKVTQTTTSSVGITVDELISQYVQAEAAGLVDEGGNWTITTDQESGIKVVGYAISDSEGQNTATNRENKWQGSGYPSMSNEVNGQTAYIQNADGSKGIRLLMSGASDNIVTRLSEVNVRVDGLTMMREENPARYTIKNIPVYNVVGLSEASASNIPVKEKYIGELTDEDVYTYVTLKDVEFTYKQSSFFCTNNGYAGMCDIYPVNVRDINGDKLYMYVNHACTWARNGEVIPQGSGKLSGVITHEVSDRFGIDGYMGRYSIRPYDKTDLQVSADPDSRYATIVEWNWDNRSMDKTADNRIRPIVGSGYLYHDRHDAFAPELKNNFNELVADATMKGAKANAACRFTTEWVDASKNMYGVNAEFSTAGITGRNMAVTFSGYAGDQSANGSGIVVPSYWLIKYSFDGETYTDVPDSRFVLHPFVCWHERCPYFATYGLHEYSVNLPAELFGRDKVLLRFVPEDNRCTTSINVATPDPAGGTLSSSTKLSVTFSDVTVKYNK